MIKTFRVTLDRYGVSAGQIFRFGKMAGELQTLFKRNAVQRRNRVTASEQVIHRYRAAGRLILSATSDLILVATIGPLDDQLLATKFLGRSANRMADVTALELFRHEHLTGVDVGTRVTDERAGVSANERMIALLPTFDAVNVLVTNHVQLVAARQRLAHHHLAFLVAHLKVVAADLARNALSVSAQRMDAVDGHLANNCVNVYVTSNFHLVATWESLGCWL